jgi:hypothetical protein
VALHFSHNELTIVSPAETWQSVPWRLKRDVPRPDIALVIGDGFSRGFLRSQGLEKQIRTSVEDHFGPNDSVLYQPLPGDQFGPDPSPLWDINKWPLVIGKWQELQPISNSDFYKSIASKAEVINKDAGRNLWTFNTKSVPYELRCYLWHLFHSFDLRLHELAKEKPFNLRQWNWTSVLVHLLRRSNLSIISFNYDEIAENAVWAISQQLLRIKRSPIQMLVEEPTLHISDLPAFVVPTYKVHGSIGAYLDVVNPFDPFFGRTQCPWLHDRRFASNRIRGARTQFTLSGHRTRFPTVPDIIPPGRPGSDICSPESRVVQLSQTSVQQARIVIFCGLSASEPDSDEVKQLIARISPNAKVVQVGVRANGDENNPLAQMIRSAGLSSMFLDAEEVSEILRTFDKLFGQPMEASQSASQVDAP